MNGRKAGAAEFLWLLVGLEGRISKLPYWLGIALVNVIAGIFLGTMMRHPEMTGPVVTVTPFVLLAAVWAEVALVVKRAHDCGITGFVGLLSLVPFVNIVMVVFFGLMPGTPGPNAYGEEPNRASWGRTGGNGTG